MSTVEEKIFKVYGAGLIPLMHYKGWRNIEWKRSIPERMGYGDWRTLRANLKADNIWLHAASMGELAGLITVIKAFDDEQINLDRFITTTSETGKQEALTKKMADKCCLLPVDNTSAIRRALMGIKPKLWLITETEIWPNLIFEIKKRGTPIIIVNARISDRSFPRYQKFKFFLQRVLKEIDFIVAQTSCDQERLIELGANPQKIEVGGSTKYDRPRTEFTNEQLGELINSMGLDSRKPIFVAGSVRPGEDKIVIETFARLKAKYPNLQMIIAPRHAENYDIVANYLRNNGLQFYRRSQGVTDKKHEIVMLDTMGELMRVYAASTVAYVGGSLVNIGGHNPLEPAAYAKPVVMGFYNHNVREIAAELKNQKGMIEVKDEEGLYHALELLLLNPTENKVCGDNAHKVWLGSQGATKRVLSRVKGLLGNVSRL